MHLRFLLTLLAFVPLLAQAQANKRYNDLAIWPGFEVRHVISDRDFLFFAHQWRFNTEPNSSTVAETGILSKPEEIRFTLGYENNLSDSWRAGLSQRIALEEDLLKWYTRVNVRHKGKIGSVAFVKRVMYEHIRPTDRSEEPEKLKPENRVRLNASLEQPFKIRGQQFSTALEYEVLFEIRPEDQNRGNDPRRVDRTRLQAELSYFPTEWYGFTLFAIKQTRYLNVLETYDENGAIKEPGGKVNRITPIIGIELQINTNLDEIDPLRNRR